MRSGAGVLLAAALIAGCTPKGNPEDKSPFLAAYSALAAVVKAKLGPKGDTPGGMPADAQASLGKALAQAKGPIVVGVIESAGLPVVLQPEAENGGFATWKSTDGRSMTFYSGIIAATRGYGPDLLAYEAEAPAAALQAGSTAPYARELRFLGSQYQLKSARLDCALEKVGSESIKIVDKEVTALRWTETCTQPGSAGKILNDYWLNGRVLVQSRQWAGPGLGHILFQRLK